MQISCRGHALAYYLPAPFAGYCGAYRPHEENRTIRHCFGLQPPQSQNLDIPDLGAMEVILVNFVARHVRKRSLKRVLPLLVVGLCTW